MVSEVIQPKMTDNTDVVLYNCDLCNKRYTIKTSYQSHMRLKHKASKASEELENGNKTSRKKKAEAWNTWIENETENPGMWTRDLDSYLDNRNDGSLAAAAVESEEAIEAEIIGEKLAVKDHELDWFEKDNNPLLFDAEFNSNFASSLRRDSLHSQPANKAALLHNEMIKKQTEKYDKLVINTTRMLKSAKKCKEEIRKREKLLIKELDETRENWQTSSEIDAEEIANLKEKVAAQTIKITELESAKKDEPEVVKQKCTKCSIVTKDGKTLRQHMKETHGPEKGKQCTQCPERFLNQKELCKHIKDHLMEKHFFCEICKKTFRTLDKAQAHASKPCASIKESGN